MTQSGFYDQSSGYNKGGMFGNQYFGGVFTPSISGELGSGSQQSNFGLTY
jgi:hypothetical protein